MRLLPFDSVRMCPACGGSVKGFTVRFSTSQKLAVGSGRFVSCEQAGDEPEPHLEKHCPRCHFGWLEAPATDLT